MACPRQWPLVPTRNAQVEKFMNRDSKGRFAALRLLTRVIVYIEDCMFSAWDWLEAKIAYAYQEKKTKLFKQMAVIAGCIALIATGITASEVTGDSESIEEVLQTALPHVEAAEAEETIPILDSICGCESEGNPKSKGSQFDKKGKLRKLVNQHKDGSTSVDIGACMINESYHEAQAVKLGFNIYEEEGNRAMAKWLFFHEGTAPWNATKDCWN